ncbi:hypothetical protein FCJ59_12985 [Cupriavidus basilensis]|nr:hypothetical protein [Cupriavidus basilensis]
MQRNPVGSVGEAVEGDSAAAQPFFEIGSISKVFTGLLLAQAVERGDLSAPWRSDDFAANALARGVSTMPASAFAVDRSTSEHGVRINLACAVSRDQLVSALRIVAQTLGDRPRALFGTI